jgi:hypothetical protein
MSTDKRTAQATPMHPFPAAIQARDHRALLDTLAPDVVLHSAVTRTTFEGRETVGEVYAAVVDSFEEVVIVDELSAEDTHAFFWRGRIDGRFVEGADRLRLDAAGKVREVTVVGRPLSGLATFADGHRSEVRPHRAALLGTRMTFALSGGHLANGQRARLDLLLDVLQLLTPALGFPLAAGLGWQRSSPCLS